MQKNESSMIMDRAGTRTSVVLQKFAKVPWLKLRRDNSVQESYLRIAAVSTRPMEIEEIDSEEERQSTPEEEERNAGNGRDHGGSQNTQFSKPRRQRFHRSDPSSS